jgi:cytochrome oxidase Cu insertion factor (SCO1/SenC/PrrC family)
VHDAFGDYHRAVADMPGELNQALSRPLYAALGWQLGVVVVLVGVILLVAHWRRRHPESASWARREREPRGRAVLRIGFAVLWLIDGLLQAQPAMPSSFVSSVLNPSLGSAPHWLAAAVDPMVRLWLLHPVSADAATVWVQVGLGVGLLAGGRSRWSRIVVVVSIAWAMFVWVFGEVLGGLADPAASWLTGAPGAALFYAIGGVLLLLPWSAWETGRAPRLARIVVGGTVLLGAVLQALPRGGYWTGVRLFSVFDDAARGGIPGPLGTPSAWLSRQVVTAPSVVNGAMIAALVVVGLGLVLGALPRTMSLVAMMLCGLAWWLAQGMGVFGGVGTDPNTGPVLLLLLAAGWPRVAVAERTDAEPDAADPPWGRSLRTAALAAAVGCLLVLPVLALGTALQPVTAQAAVGDSGGLQPMAPQPAPQISLTDQSGQPLSLSRLRGNVVLVAFLDPVCFEDCPLLANQLATATRLLGPAGRTVQILAVDVNPTFHAVQDVKTFSDEHGLSDLPNWHFVTGSNAAVGAVLAAYGQGVSVPRVGMIGHPEAIYLIDRNGDAVGVLNDTADATLTRSYAQLIAEQVRHYL